MSTDLDNEPGGCSVDTGPASWMIIEQPAAASPGGRGLNEQLGGRRQTQSWTADAAPSRGRQVRQGQGQPAAATWASGRQPSEGPPQRALPGEPPHPPGAHTRGVVSGLGLARGAFSARSTLPASSLPSPLSARPPRGSRPPGASAAPAPPPAGSGPPCVSPGPPVGLPLWLAPPSHTGH